MNTGGTGNTLTRRLAESYRQDYRFYMRCMQVLSRRGCKGKLMNKIKSELTHAEEMYRLFSERQVIDYE